MAVKTFTTPGVYTWTVPAGVTEITNVDAAGGQGGKDWSGAVNGGKGARVQVATLGVDPGSTLTIIVGGQGGQGVTTDNGSGAEGSGVDGGNGDTLITLAGGAFAPAGEGRSGGGGGGGVSGIHFAAGALVVTAGAAGGGGGGGSHPSGRAGGAGAAAPTTAGGNGGGTFIGYGGNRSRTTNSYLYGSYGAAEGVNTTPAERGHKGRDANGSWTIETKTGGGGGGGSATFTAGGGGGSRNADSIGYTDGSGGGGGSGTNAYFSSYGGYSGVTETGDYQTGAGYVVFEYPAPGGIYVDGAVHF